MAVRIEQQQQTLVVSSELTQMVETFADNYIRVTSGELAQKILEKARAEGLSDNQIRQLIEAALMKRQLKERAIRQALPKELKRGYTVKPKPNSAGNAESNNSDTATDSSNEGSDNSTVPLANDYCYLTRSLFGRVLKAIQQAMDNGEDRIVIRHGSHQVISIGDEQTIEVS